MRTSPTHLVADNLELERDNVVLQLILIIMSRLRQNQNIDELILSISSIVENRCSLSDKDLLILNEALCQLENLKRKKGKTNKEILQVVVQIVDLLSCFFKNDSEN